MTVAQLIKKLQNFDPDMQVVIKANAKNFPDDFNDLNVSDLAVVTATKLFNEPFWGKQVYDASPGTLGSKVVKVLSLSGPSSFDRMKNER